MSGHPMSTSTFAPTLETKCVLTRRSASVVMSNITMAVEYLRCQRPEMAHSKLTTSCKEWDSHYSTHAQTHVQISLRHRLHIVEQLDRLRREATAAKNLLASVTLYIHNDSTRSCAARSQRINWVVESLVATSPRRRISQTRQLLHQVPRAVQAPN